MELIPMDDGVKLLSTFTLKGRKVSERSLEFNVLSEVLDIIRRFLGKAYIVGYNTRQEAYHGLDASIDAPGMIIAAYQFKAPSSGRGDIYRFTVGDRCWLCSNPRLGSRSQSRREIIEILRRLGVPETCVNQHTLLYVTATVLEKFMNTSVYYAFPLARDYVELEQRTPGIINYTVLIRVKDMPIRTVLDCRRHRVEIMLPGGNLNNMTVTIYSESERLPKNKYTILSNAIKSIITSGKLPEARQSIHLDPEDVRQILEKELRERAEKEGIEPELTDRIPSLTKALTTVSFSYRGTVVVAKSKRKELRQ